MKKLVLGLCAVCLAMALVACSGGGGMADGTYTAKSDEAFAADNHGWTDQLTVTYQGGKITSASYESVNAEGLMKSQATFEQYPMEYSPSEWIPLINSNVVAAGTSAKVDNVSGATNASDSAKALLAGIEKDGKAGETITVQIPATK